MIYSLPDGTSFDLQKVSEISEIKDYGEDEQTIDESTLCFTVRMVNGKSIKVSLNYHYNDWFNVYKELKEIRNDIIIQWNKCKQEKK
jgi:hypothetical protein